MALNFKQGIILEKKFKLISKYKPKGDQPTAIKDIMEALERGDKFITLLGATGTGKTFSVSNIIEKYQRPTLIMAPNKTLATQLYQEFKDFFPNNAVEYFISYYDYYQPEAYLPAKGQYIEKDLDINVQIQRYRLSTLKSLITRKDIIVIASVSCIFGSENPESRKKNYFHVESGESISVRQLSKKLINIQYQRNDIEVKPGLFKVRGDTVTIYPAEHVDFAHKIMFFGDEIEEILDVNPVSGEIINKREEITLFPALEFITDRSDFENIVDEIKSDLEKEVKAFKDQKRFAEAQRLEQRVNFDLEMIREMGSVKGIENYSRYFDNRKPGEPSYTIMDYFPKDFLLIMDESHLGVPQIHGMIGGDIARKRNLIDYGFRLKAAYDNRPLRFEEWEKKISHVIFTSATPGNYEIEHSNTIADQVIRPTGLLDPIVEVRDTNNQIEDLLNEIIDFRESIYPNDNKTKWEGKDKLHLTLKFLGDVVEEDIPEINKKLEIILNNHNRIEIKFSKFGIIKKYSTPKILLMDIQQNKSLVNLFNDINNGLSDIGFEKERRRFRPHITLLRLKGNEDISKLEILNSSTININSSLADEVALIKSDLLPTGSVYTKIKSFKLNRGGLNG